MSDKKKEKTLFEKGLGRQSTLKDVIIFVLSYWAGKLFGWIYIFYLLAVVGGMLTTGPHEESYMDGGLIFNWSLFLAAALLPWVILSIISLIIKWIKPGPDIITKEIKTIVIFTVFVAVFIISGLLGNFVPSVFVELIKIIWFEIVIGLTILIYGSIKLSKLLKSKPKSKSFIKFYFEDLRFLQKLFLIIYCIIFFYAFMIIINITFMLFGANPPF